MLDISKNLYYSIFMTYRKFYKHKLPQQLKKVLKQKNMTQKQLAEILNVSASTISSYCTGRTEPSFDNLLIICRTFKKRANYMLGVRTKRKKKEL